jgi:hypothetical protein
MRLDSRIVFQDVSEEGRCIAFLCPREPRHDTNAAREHARNERQKIEHHQNPLRCSSRYTAATPNAAAIQSMKSSRRIERQNHSRMCPPFPISPSHH